MADDNVPDEQESPEPVEAPAPVEEMVEEDDEELNKQIEKQLGTDAKDSKTHRRTFYATWKRNVELRLGKPEGGLNITTTSDATSETPDDEFRSEINPDWYLTKTKTANLYSQVPTVRGTHENATYKDAVAPFMKELNYQLGEKRANIGVAMEEVLNDVINASGIGAILVGYAARFVKKVDPAKIPPEVLAQYPPESIQKLIDSDQLPTVSVAVSDKFFGTRLSPTDLLWPKSFKGSDFNDSPWVGYTGEKFKAEAEVDFKLTPADLEQIANGKERDAEDDLRSESDRGVDDNAEKVFYDHIFYWRYLYDPDEKNMKAIWEIVFVHGKAEPVIHQLCKCQRAVEGAEYQYVGACKFPLQFLTLTYITDNPVPPSDSEAGRPQVNDLRLSRSQLFANRARSTPLRWYDVNRTNKDVQMMLSRGDIQGFIPTNGSGDKVIGEVARAAYPAEDLSFDRQTLNDLYAVWQTGPNQMGTMPAGERTKAEVELTQGNFSTRIGQERARVARFFLNIAEIMAGYIALYSDFKVLTEQERTAMMNAWDQRTILQDLVLTIRPDSTVMMDTMQEFSKLNNFLNITVKSGLINPLPILTRMAELVGLDPNEVVVPPKPKKEESEENVSFRFSGKDDLMNPIVLAMLIKAGKAPSPEELQAALKMQEAALMGIQPQQPPQQPPMGPEGPQAAPEGGVGAHPGWQLQSKIAQRSEDLARE